MRVFGCGFSADRDGERGRDVRPLQRLHLELPDLVGDPPHLRAGADLPGPE